LNKFILYNISHEFNSFYKNIFSFEELQYSKRIIKDISLNSNYYTNKRENDQHFKYMNSKTNLSNNENKIIRKFLSINMNFDLIKLEKIIINPKDELKETYCYNYDNYNKKIYLNIIEYLIIYSKKHFYLRNHLNYKIYINFKNINSNDLDIDYKLIFEEHYDNFSKVEFNNLDKFLVSYWKTEKDYISYFKGKKLSIIIAFSEYKPIKKYELNKLELILFRENYEVIIGKNYNNLFKNFFEDNKKFVSILKKYDISIEDPKNFIKNINDNNPFKHIIISNYIVSNKLNLEIFYDSKMNYVYILKIKFSFCQSQSRI